MDLTSSHQAQGMVWIILENFVKSIEGSFLIAQDGHKSAFRTDKIVEEGFGLLIFPTDVDTLFVELKRFFKIMGLEEGGSLE